MRIFNKFIESKKEPSNKNDIWFDGSVFRIYKEEEWQAFTVNLNDANEIAILKDELYEFLYDEAKPTVEEAKQAAAIIQEYVDKAIDALALSQQSLANSKNAITEATALKSQTEQLIEQGDIVIENANRATDIANETSLNIKAIWDDLFIEINNSITSANEAASNANTAAETIDSKIAEKVEPVLNLLDTLPFFNLNEDYTKIIKGEAVRTEEFVRDVSGHNYLISYDGELYYINDDLIIGSIIPSTMSYVELEMSRWYVSNSSFKYNEESNKYEPSGFYGFIPARLLLDGTDSFSDVLFPHFGGHNMILKTEQQLTEEEKEQVKKNLDIKKDIESLQTQLDSHDILIEDLQDNKVDKGDYAPALTSGFADNLVGSDVIVDKDFTIRKSGDGAILDGAARMEVVNGNSVVWNQLAKEINATNWGVYNSTFASPTFSNGEINVAVQDITLTGYRVGITLKASQSLVIGHIYLAVGEIKCAVPCRFTIEVKKSSVTFGEVTTTWTPLSAFVTSDHASTKCIISPQGTFTESTNTYSVRGVRLVDLTQMFGAGNEPTTIEEFNARKPKVEDEYAYNEGEVIHCNVDAVKSVGRNVWDEEWELGSLNSTGGLKADNTRIRPKNFTRVIPNETYYFNLVFTYGVYFYDSNKNYVTTLYGSNKNLQIPSNVMYLKFNLPTGYGTTYNHDICINLSDPDFNGKYEPYKEDIKEIPTAIKEAFPEGMMSAGTAHDVAYNDLNKEVGVTEKRIGVVDLGTLNWKYDTTYGSFNLRAAISSLGFKGSSDTMLQANIVCSKYTASPYTGTGSTIDKTVKTYMSAQLRVLDSSYTDAASFKEDMQGVMLYYELAEPIVTEHDEPFNLDYQVANGGQEQAIANKKTSAFKAKIAYGFNAAAKIKENANEIENLKAIITQLQAALANGGNNEQQ